jgi:hypothetical protein
VYGELRTGFGINLSARHHNRHLHGERLFRKYISTVFVHRHGHRSNAAGSLVPGEHHKEHRSEPMFDNGYLHGNGNR